MEVNFFGWPPEMMVASVATLLKSSKSPLDAGDAVGWRVSSMVGDGERGDVL